MIAVSSWSRERAWGALGAALLELLIGYGLIFGLSVKMSATADSSLKLFDVAPPRPAAPPVEKTAPRPKPSKRPEGAASPPNLRAKRTEVVAPVPVVPLVAPPPVIATPLAGTGNAAFAGAADIRGPGTGSGGEGEGAGSGGEGYGHGGGSDNIPPRLRRGRIRNSDYPAAAGEEGVGGTVSVRYTVETDGRVTHCIVTASSGDGGLDETTCRLIEKRFRYDPSRDPVGRPVRSTIIENHSWFTEEAPPERGLPLSRP